MPNISIHKAGDLPQGLKCALEQLLDRPIRADEEVSITAVPPQEVPRSGNRSATAEKLQWFLDRRAAKVADVSDHEIDAALDEALDHARHRRA